MRLHINLKLIFYSPTYLSPSLSLSLSYLTSYFSLSSITHATDSFSLSLSQLQKCYHTSLSSPLLPISLEWWWRGGGVKAVGCGLGGLWVLWHGFLLGCGVVQWLWRGGGMAMGLGWVARLWISRVPPTLSSSQLSGSTSDKPTGSDLSLCWLVLGWPDLCLGGWINGGLVFGWLWVGVLVAGLVFGWVFCCCWWLFGYVWWWGGGMLLVCWRDRYRSER